MGSRTLYRRGDGSDAMNTFDRINISRYYELSDRQMMKRARKLYKKNKLHEALGLLTALQKKGAASPEVSYLLALNHDRMAFLMNDLEHEETAKQLYEKLLRSRLGFFQKRRVEKAYRRLLNRIQEFTETEYRAVHKASEMKERTVRTPKAWVLLGSNFNIRKDVDFVINAYRSAVEMDPNYILALFRLAYVYQFNKQDEREAMRCYIRLVKLDPAGDSNESETTNARCILEACNHLSLMFYRRSEYRKVVALFNRALEVQNDYLPISSLTLVKDLIYLAGLSAERANLREQMEGHMQERYELSFAQVVTSYGRSDLAL